MWYPPLTGHENRELAWVNNRFPSGGQFIDIGAHIGLYSIKLARNFREIVAVEANPIQTFILNKNIELNHIKNVRILEVAAWDKVQMLFFNQEFANVGQPPTTNTFPVLGVPLDAYSFNPEFIKMDIEGAEYIAIYGLKETIERTKPVMLIEIHQYTDDRTVARFQDIMEKLGYRCTETFGMGTPKVPMHDSFNCVFEYKKV
jgi:FkbM family methyltransferase